MRAGRAPDALTAVFLDRDGVINRKAPEGSYVTSPAALELLPGALEGLRLLADLDVPVVVVTNQRGIALGRMSEADLERIHERLRAEVEAAGARLDLIVHCPHDHGECDCRKPGIGMFERAAGAFPSIELERSVVIGDSASDMEAARHIGAKAVLVADEGVADADLVVPSLLAAAELLVATRS
jgi:D-glycero-D-manno-heptose 1,7-bisphosphate phosphatase